MQKTYDSILENLNKFWIFQKIKVVFPSMCDSNFRKSESILKL